MQMWSWFRRHILRQRAHLNLHLNISPLPLYPLTLLERLGWPFSSNAPAIRIESSYLDPHGQYVLLNCDHMNTSFTPANVYAPNSGQLRFLEEFFEKLQPFFQTLWSTGGTLNFVCPHAKTDFPCFKTPLLSWCKKHPLRFEEWSEPIIRLTLGEWSTQMPNNSRSFPHPINYTRDWTISLSLHHYWHTWSIWTYTRSDGQITHP